MSSAITMALRMVFSHRNYVAIYLLMALILALAYYYLFTYSSVLFNYVPSINMYLILITALSVVMGALVSLNLLLLIYDLRIRSMSKGLVGITIGSVSSTIVSTTMCCTSIIPTLVSLVSSQAFLITGKIGGFIATISPLLIALSLGLLVLGLYEGSKRIAGNCCVVK